MDADADADAEEDEDEDADAETHTLRARLWTTSLSQQFKGLKQTSQTQASASNEWIQNPKKESEN